MYSLEYCTSDSATILNSKVFQLILFRHLSCNHFQPIIIYFQSTLIKTVFIGSHKPSSTKLVFL